MVAWVCYGAPAESVSASVLCKVCILRCVGRLRWEYKALLETTQVRLTDRGPERRLLCLKEKTIHNTTRTLVCDMLLF